jgi:RNA polymerase sigma-70 factor (ECF subfamily)
MVIRDEMQSHQAEQVADILKQLETRVANWLTALQRRAVRLGRTEARLAGGQEKADLVQEALAWAAAHLNELLGIADDDVIALLQRVLHDKAVDLSRGKERHERRLQRYGELLLASPQEAPPADAEPTEAERRRVVAEALDSLRSPYREVVAGHFLKKQTWEEIGRHVGCTERHARRLYAQALDILRRTLEGRV